MSVEQLSLMPEQVDVRPALIAANADRRPLPLPNADKSHSSKVFIEDQWGDQVRIAATKREISEAIAKKELGQARKFLDGGDKSALEEDDHRIA